MSPRSAPLSWRTWGAAMLFLSLVVASEAADVKNVTVRPGDNATLQCYGPRGAAVEALQWSRADQKTDYYVFFYRNKHPIPSYQLESFRGRVVLGDPWMRGGNVSVVLLNATANDTGTYECRVSADRRAKRNEPEPSSIIRLTVAEPDLPDDGTRSWSRLEVGVMAVVSVLVMVVGGVVGLVMKGKCKAYDPPPEQHQMNTMGSDS